MEGKLLQTGDNLTICGNPVALLYKSVGINYRHEQCFEAKDDVIQCYTERFGEGEYLAGFRSPHNSPNNICLPGKCISGEAYEIFSEAW